MAKKMNQLVGGENIGMIYDECVIEGIMENDSDEDKFYAKKKKHY